MPMYSFQCSDEECLYHEKPILELCSVTEYEILKETKKCPIHETLMKPLIGGHKFMFKGAGFHATDYNKQKDRLV